MFFLLIFTSLFVSRYVFEHHFGFVMNSDALYPYLFAEDLFHGSVHGWNLPPSSTLFPDVALTIILYGISSSPHFVFHGLGIFFSFGVFFLSKQLSFSNSISYLISILFLILNYIYVDSLGSFLLPSFHGSLFWILAYLLWEIQKENTHMVSRAFKLSLLFGLIGISEYWFFLEVFPVLLVYVLCFRPKMRVTFALSSLLGFGFAILVGRWLRNIGLHVASSKDLQLWNLIQERGQVLIESRNLDVFLNLSNFANDRLFFWFLFYMFLYSFYFCYTIYQKKIQEQAILICFGVLPLFSMIGLSFFAISAIDRYLLFLPFFLIVFFIVYWEILWKNPSSLLVLCILGLCFFIYTQYSPWREKVDLGKRLRSERIQCVSETVRSGPVVSSYWPSKYFKTFAQFDFVLIPFTKEGIYYPWVSNKSWYQNVLPSKISDAQWIITDDPNWQVSDLGFSLAKSCVGLQIYKKSDLP